jgi:hypothetical protein
MTLPLMADDISLIIYFRHASMPFISIRHYYFFSDAFTDLSFSDAHFSHARRFLRRHSRY